MMNHSFTVGYVPLAKGSWRDDRLEGIRCQSLQVLKQACGAHELVGGDRLVTTDAEAMALLDEFEKSGVDVIVFHFITFSLGTIVPLMTERLKVPVVFWSMPEPAMTGGRISSNSFCAVNMNAHTLWKLNRRYLHVHAPVDEACGKLSKALSPVVCGKKLSQTKLGLVGHRVPGFYTSDANELLLRRQLGVEIENITLWELIRLADGLASSTVAQAADRFKASAVRIHGPDEGEIRKGAALHQAFLEVKSKYQVDTFAVKCWPEFGEYFGIGVCAILSMLNDQGIMTGCEGDVYGTVTMMIENHLTGQLPFFCDLISIDGQDNTGIAWHCGAAPKSLADPHAQPTLCKHSIIDGGGRKGLTNEFPLKPGRVTLARLSENRNGDGYRMLMALGTAVPTEQILRGNPLCIRFDAPMASLADLLVYQGFEHHFSVVHGDILHELMAFCRLKDIEPIFVK